MASPPPKRFVYLIQAAEKMPYDQLPDAGCEILLLTWKRPADFPRAVFYPGSTWNEGRNRLLYEARRQARNRGKDYLYYIFLDDDCEVKEDEQLARRLGVRLTGNPFRTFERYLLEWEPAVAYTRYSWQHYEPGAEVNLGYNIDGNFNAFHREALSFLLPYYTGFDGESWLYSQHILNHLMAMLYNSYRIQFNVLLTKNKRRRSYTPRKKYWTIPTNFLLNAVRSDLAARINVDEPNSSHPPPGRPRKKDRSYTITEDFVREHFDRGHPFIKYRRLDQAAAPPGPFVRLADSRVAVCITGHCRSLKLTHANIRSNLLERLGRYDVFMYVPEDDYSHRAELLAPAVWQAAADRIIDEGSLVNGINCRLKSGVQSYLQQLYGLKRCNRLRLEYERRKGVRYDCVIRCRTDIWFVEPVDCVTPLDLRYVYVPDFHQFDGCNDRFAIGSAEHMSVYMNKFDAFEAHALRWLAKNPGTLPLSAEMFTAGHLREHNIAFRHLAVRFNRVRGHKISRDVGPG